MNKFQVFSPFFFRELHYLTYPPYLYKKNVFIYRCTPKSALYDVYPLSVKGFAWNGPPQKTWKIKINVLPLLVLLR